MKRKRTIEIRKDVKATPEVKSISQVKREFAELIERYKKQNPAKFALKKDALEAKLKRL